MSNPQSETTQRFARLFKALSNPHRLQIFMRLVGCCGPGARLRAAGEGCACVGEISKDLGIVASTVSHHLKELHDAGVIRMERRGQNVECSVDPETLKDLCELFAQCRAVCDC